MPFSASSKAVPSRLRAVSAARTVLGSHFVIFLIQQLKKTRLGNQLGSDTEKVTNTTGNLSPTESKWVPEFVLNRNDDLMKMIFSFGKTMFSEDGGRQNT